MGKRYNSPSISCQVDEQTELFNNRLQTPGADTAWPNRQLPQSRPDCLGQIWKLLLTKRHDLETPEQAASSVYREPVTHTPKMSKRESTEKCSQLNNSEKPRFFLLFQEHLKRTILISA